MTTRKKWLRRGLCALLCILAVDQLLYWTLATRPIAGIRALVELTQSEAPPYYVLPRQLSSTYRSWGRASVTQIHTNSLGLRDIARAEARPAGVKRVILTGDSITFGIGVNDDESFPAQLQAALKRAGRDDVEAWNAGVPGYAMADHLGWLRSRLLSFAPDVIVLQLSRNDDAVPMPLSPWFMKTLRVSGLARSWMLYRFNFVRDPALFRSSFRAYVDECRRAGVKLVIAFEGLPNSNRTEVLDIARNEGIPIFEIGGDAFPKLPDDPHFNTEGNRRVAERLLPEVLSLVPPP